jgi:hypothetical protein
MGVSLVGLAFNGGVEYDLECFHCLALMSTTDSTATALCTAVPKAMLVKNEGNCGDEEEEHHEGKGKKFDHCFVSGWVCFVGLIVSWVHLMVNRKILYIRKLFIPQQTRETAPQASLRCRSRLA